jgi:surface antigen
VQYAVQREAFRLKIRFHAPLMHLDLQAGQARSKAFSRRAAVLLSLLTATIAGLGLGAPKRAYADTDQLCAGYAACSAEPFTTHGYQSFDDVSWWTMYPGENCTNYAAYVESHVYGVPTPGYHLGDADQWADDAAANGVAVDSTPSAGAVATWEAGVPQMSGYGHVAVVEDVATDGSYIDVSQSGMGTADDGFNWERIYTTGNSWEPWPTSFIHFSATRLAGNDSPSAVPQAGKRIGGTEVVYPGMK